MALSFKKQLINYLSRRNFKSQNAFTLVELIVVVVIIGILSSIAIPSFQNASEKAKQKEASSMLASYAKAAQAYYTEYGQLAISPRNLGEYVTVSACRYGTVSQCKSAGNALYNNTSTRTNMRWYSPSGNYQIFMNRRAIIFNLIKNFSCKAWHELFVVVNRMPAIRLGNFIRKLIIKIYI